MKPHYIVNLDKLTISFELDTTNFQKNLNQSKQLLHILSPKNKYNRDYKESYIILEPTTKEHLFFIDIGFRFNLTFNRIRVVNKTLYRSNFQSLLETLITSYRLLNPVVRYIDICIDTNQPLIKRFNHYYNELKPISNYCFDYYGNEDDRVINGVTNETKYIKKRKTNIDSNNRLMRIENKSKEIETNNFQKLYIKQNLNRKGLDINKRVERIELRLNYKIFQNINLVYVNKFTGKEISKYHYDKLPFNRVVKDIWDIPIIQTKTDYIRKKKYTQIVIDINQLSNSDYLLSIFNQYSVFNHDKIINLSNSYIKPQRVIELRELKPTTNVVSVSKLERENYLKEQQIEYYKDKLKELIGNDYYLIDTIFD